MGRGERRRVGAGRAARAHALQAHHSRESTLTYLTSPHASVGSKLCLLRASLWVRSRTELIFTWMLVLSLGVTIILHT